MERIPDPAEHSRSDRQGESASRRNFLKSLGATAALAAFPGSAEAFRRLDALREQRDEEYFNTLIADPAARRAFREAPTPDQRGSLLRSLAKVKPQWLQEFERDEDLFNRHTLPQCNRVNGKICGNATIIRIPVQKPGERGITHHHLLITASHVADQVDPPSGTSWTRHKSGRDVAVRELDERDLAVVKISPDKAFPFHPLKRGQDITGAVGAVIALGRDRDRKLYPSRISPTLSTRWVRPPDLTKLYERPEDMEAIRMIVLPPGQGTPVKENFHGKTMDIAPAAGVSGAAFVYVPDGSSELSFGGVFTGAGVMPADGSTYDTGYVLDPTYVQEAIEHHFKTTLRSKVTLSV
ncbi:MAG: hypothetical protein RLZZ416_718 [Candidatus Parcubacteria bacterium]|jgi:hypothetical protein